jgi:hypothetical protein
MSDPNQQFHVPMAPAPVPVPVWEPVARPTKLRPIAIGLFVIGLIVLVTGILKVVPGGIGTGVAFAFWGILLFVFSFIPLPQAKGADEPAMSGLAKITGIFYEPVRVFKNLRSHPHWLGAFLVICILNAGYAAAFVQRLTPERIVDYTMDKLEQSPIKPPPDRMAEAKDNALQQAKQPVQRVQTAAKSFVGVFVFLAFLSALYLLGVLAFGGRINYWQAFAATAYAFMPVAVLTRVISLIILFVKSPDDIHPILGQETLVQDNLGVLFSPAEHPALYVLGASIGIISFYGLWLKAKGLTNAGQKVSSSAGWGVAITFWVLGLLLGMVFATLFSSFLS